MKEQKEKKSQTPTVLRLCESTKAELNQRSHDENKSINYIAEKAIRKGLRLKG